MTGTAESAGIAKSTAARSRFAPTHSASVFIATSPVDAAERGDGIKGLAALPVSCGNIPAAGGTAVARLAKP